MRNKNSDYIKIEDCIHGGLYKVDCRNFSYGVFNKKDSSFIGIRHKFGYTYLFSEYHWDSGPPFGTAKPLGFIKKCDLPDDLIIDHEMVIITQEMIDRGEVSPHLKAGVETFQSNTKLEKWLRKNIK